MLWCALVLPDLALQVFTRGRDEGPPLAVLGPLPQRRVVAADPAAMARGVAPGVRRASALALAPDLCLRDREPALEHSALAEIADWAGAFTSTLSIDPPDTLLLEVRASLRLFGGMENLCGQLQQGLDALGFKGRLAVAPTPLAARWLARQAPGARIDTLASLATALDPLPFSVLADSPGEINDSLDLLAGIGLRQLVEVRRLPRSSLARRKGGALLDLLDRAYGVRADPRPWHIPPERYRARLPLPVPSTQIDTLLFGLRRLLAGLSGWLDARQAGLEAISLILEYERNSHDSEERFEIIPGTLSRDMARFQMLAREHLSRHALPAAVDALRLEADAPRPIAPPRHDLFEGDDGRQGDPGLLLATLRARLGTQAVACLAPCPDHRPERAWRWLYPQGPAPSGTQAGDLQSH
ncbi:DNA polymerase Y family protein, partial [Zoogloea sp.]|uniref:Y-family DNA polymerase n=1 Tax=Zoogloea sp. TaxID=49181 RepID=UPI00141599DF